MKFTTTIAQAFVVALALGMAPATFAQGQPPADALTDPSLKGSEVIAFVGIKPGDEVADIIAGRFLRAFSNAVGPTGKVYAFEASELVKAHPQVLDMVNAVTADPAHSNVVLLTEPIDAPALPGGLDVIFIRQNYHDLHDNFMGPADVPLFNKNVFKALKPGGVYVVLDHADAAGAGLKNTDALHRIDVASVKAEVLAAGFVLAEESRMFANPADDHSKIVFDPSIRGKTDQFLLKFRKPK